METKARTAVIHSPVWMVLFAFIVRLLYILVMHSYRYTRPWWFESEMANLAYSVATGHGFRAPWGGDTGASAWTPPIYPWIISVAFRGFGVYSYAAAFAMLMFNSVFSALTSWTIYHIARRVFNETVAIWSGWIWVLLPHSIYWATWVWETSLSAFLLSLLFLLTLEMEGDDRLSLWFGYGLLWGIVGLTATSALAWLPFSGCWLAYQLHRRGRRFLAPVVFSTLVFWAALMPWLVRNYFAFGKPVFVRGNLGVELRSGNNPLADGGWVPAYHPHHNATLYKQYKQMGEAAFVTEQGRLAEEWIAQHPKRFLVVSFRRFVFFWSGKPQVGLEETKNFLFLAMSLMGIGGALLAAKRRVHGVFLFATLLLFYPLIYYFTFPHSRYRHPIDPELLILGVYMVLEARPRAVAANIADDSTELNGSEVVPPFHTLSIIVPVFNERKTIMKLLRQVAQQTVSLHKELIIIDDCSTDGTREYLQGIDLNRELGEGGINCIRLLLHDVNKGKGAGVRTGLAQASGELVLIQDADLEYDPGDYPLLLKPILEGRADAVFGNRFHDGPHRVPRYYRYVLNRIFSMLCNTLTGLHIHDVTACYKVFRRDLLERMHLRSDRFSVETEMTVKLAKMGCRIYEVPIVYHGRTYAEGKKISWKDGWVALYDLVRYRFSD